MFRLVYLRETSGKSIKDVCDFLGCCRAQLYNLEHGRYNPDNVSYVFIDKLADLYNVSCDYIYKFMCDDFSEVDHRAAAASVDPDQYEMTFVK